MDQPTSQESKNGVIIVRLLGGLGNQMFQYALGRHLSLIHKRPLKLDLSFYHSEAARARWAVRSYGLNNFQVQPQTALENELLPFKKYLQPNFVSRLLRRLSGLGSYYRREYIFEPLGHNFIFDQRLLKTQFPPTVYLDGFWQTEKYFLGIEDLIRQDFKFKLPPNELNSQMLQEMALVNSVAIHIRHGDNATKVAAKHGVLPMEYYRMAIESLAAKINSPHFYIFSDDPVWAKNNLHLTFPATFVTHNGDEKNYEDLRLMTACQHHIIGNSTFSWWGAWLGKKPGQLVYAPSRYQMQGKGGTYDLYPNNWFKISC